jgi:uncharacterized protein YciW
MLEFAEFLNTDPANIREENVQALREAGWADGDIIDIVHITALYNYMVRIADGLGIELDPGQGWEPVAQNLPFRDKTAPRSFGKIVAGPPD